MRFIAPAHWHVLVALPVAADHVVALLLQPLGQVAGDEAAGAGDADAQLLLGPVLLRAIHRVHGQTRGSHGG
jgi:hypothetical protein